MFEKVPGADEYRWGRLTVAPFRLGCCVYKTNNNWGLHAFWFWLEFGAPKVPPKEMYESWGFTYSREALFSALHLNWGNYTKIIDMPWSWEHVKHEYKLRTGVYLQFPTNSWEYDDEYAYKRHYPYTYTLKSGEVQNRVAEVTVERRTWRRRWWPWSKKVRNYIEVKFDQEVGERTGSWKGGCIGCSYDLQINETPYECLKRMEKERKFD